MTNNTSTDTLQHERYCLPRAGETELRVESYTQARYAADGVTTIGQAQITRCVECGSMSIDGRPAHR